MDNCIDICISDTALSIDRCYDFVQTDVVGGICIFVGTVRIKNKNKTVTHLDFEAYESMAKKEMHKIAEHCIKTLGAQRISIHHRTGSVHIGEKAVVITASSIHRDIAFAACRYAIDTLKNNVPIWKKEHLTDGSYWVNATP